MNKASFLRALKWRKCYQPLHLNLLLLLTSSNILTITMLAVCNKVPLLKQISARVSFPQVGLIVLMSIRCLYKSKHRQGTQICIFIIVNLMNKFALPMSNGNVVHIKQGWANRRGVVWQVHDSWIMNIQERLFLALTFNSNPKSNTTVYGCTSKTTELGSWSFLLALTALWGEKKLAGHIQWLKN